MADDPRPFGLVHGRIYAGVGDTVDAGRAPDRVGLNGTAVFTANVERVITTTQGSESIDVPQKITAQVTNGALQWLGTDDVPLIANLDAAGNSLGWQWRVDFSLTFTDPTTNTASRVTLTGWAFDVKVYNPAAALVNGVNPTITQLTTQAPVNVASSTLLAKGDPGPAVSFVVGTVATTTDPTAAAVTVVATADPLVKQLNFVLPVGVGGGGGAGTVTKVANVAPDGTGNVNLSPSAIGAAAAADVATAQSTASNALSTATGAQSAANSAQTAANAAQSTANGKVDPSALFGLAPLASPTFTGDPKAPTPATSDNDTSIATTAFVKAVVATISAAGLFNTAVVGWNATTQTWGSTRPSVAGPVKWISTNDPGATRPASMATGDNWEQHPDAVA
jgi:hypothetical protein